MLVFCFKIWPSHSERSLQHHNLKERVRNSAIPTFPTLIFLLLHVQGRLDCGRAEAFVRSPGLLETQAALHQDLQPVGKEQLQRCFITCDEGLSKKPQATLPTVWCYSFSSYWQSSRQLLYFSFPLPLAYLSSSSLQY